MIITAVGDIHIRKSDPDSIFKYVATVFQNADIALANQETPICDQGQPVKGKIEVGSVYLRSVTGTAQALRRAGFSAVGFASNHSMDYGPEGLFQSLQLLDDAGVAHAGGGRDLAEAHKPAIIRSGGATVTMLAYTSVYPPAGFAASESKPGISTVKVHTAYQSPENVFYQPGLPAITVTIPDPVETARMLDDVRQAKKGVDVVVVSIHWGVPFPDGRVVGYQKELGRAAIEAGADMVMGHHPHRVCGMEMYKGKLICYGLGNFALQAVVPSHHGKETLIVKAYVRDKQVERFTFLPARINSEFQPQVVYPQEGADILKMVEAASEPFGTAFTIEGKEVVISGPKPGTPEPERGMSILCDSYLPLRYLKGSRLRENPGG